MAKQATVTDERTGITHVLAGPDGQTACGMTIPDGAVGTAPPAVVDCLACRRAAVPASPPEEPRTVTTATGVLLSRQRYDDVVAEIGRWCLDATDVISGYGERIRQQPLEGAHGWFAHGFECTDLIVALELVEVLGEAERTAEGVARAVEECDRRLVSVAQELDEMQERVDAIAGDDEQRVTDDDMRASISQITKMTYVMLSWRKLWSDEAEGSVRDRVTRCLRDAA